MNRKSLIVVCGVCLLASAGALFAHPSSNIAVRYDAASAMLTVEAAHQVKDATTHFIKTITVTRNGKSLITQACLRQVNTQQQQAVYLVPGLAAGDELAVTTTCSKYGTQTVKMKVE